MFENTGIIGLTQHTFAGRCFTSGLSVNNVASGSRYRSVFSNPVGSGVYMAIVNIVFTSQTDEFFTLMLNPTVKPTAAQPVGNRLVGSPLVAKGQVFADVSTTAMSGGVALSYGIAATNGARESEDLDPPFVLMPGYSIGVELLNALGLAADASFVATWLEIPIP